LKKLLHIFLLMISLPMMAQDSTRVSALPDSISHKRQRLVGGLSIAAYGGSLLMLNQAWYSQYDRTSFHTFDDSGEWLQVDKTGHAWSAYNLSRASTAAWRWTGMPEKKAVWVGSLSGFTYLTAIEVLDAYSESWGWSWADMAANASGSLLFALQESGWKEQRIQFKFSAHRIDYEPALQSRAGDLFGRTLPERLLKDYNGQTYWFSFNLKSFAPQTRLPSWLNLSVGYGASGLYGGFANIAYDDHGDLVFDRRDIQRRRQWYLSPDIDLTKIKTRSKFLKTSFSVLNAIKIPAPALEFSNGKFHGRWIAF
jgi:hypothetical protein